MMTTMEQIKMLVEELNSYRDAYYNTDSPLVSDKLYDQKFDMLRALEEQTGFILSNSPTRTVGYPIVSSLAKVVHNHPMLSLDKTKDVSKVIQFLNYKPGLAMAKMDGLTCSLTYRDGQLVRAETRGNGTEGEDITHNIRTVANVPQNINLGGEVIIDGEVIIKHDDFLELREMYKDSKGKKYKNARNLAAGSIRLLDSVVCNKRRLNFIAWRFEKGYVGNSFCDALWQLQRLGFEVCPFIDLLNTVKHEKSHFENVIDVISILCKEKGYGIDGIVFSFNDIDYSKALGMTSHHSRAQIAYKFEDELYDTTVYDIDWTMGKTGVLTPTAIFETVEIDGTDVSRANLHNLTIMSQLGIKKNCTAYVYKANMIIPQIEKVDDDGDAEFEIPDVCPICGYNTVRVKENDSEVLMCGNSLCSGKLLGKLCAYVSKDAMDIDGLSEGKLQYLMDEKLVNSVIDLYNLHKYADYLKMQPGWGETSVNKLLDSIEKSKTVKLENFITALSIPNIGLASAKFLAKYVNYNVNDFISCLENKYDFSKANGFGEKTNNTIHQWWETAQYEVLLLLNIITINDTKEETTVEGPLSGKTFCITGTFSDKRSDLQKMFEQLGGTFVSSVTKSTDILFAGEKAGSKLKKAQDLGITIYNVDETYNLLEVNGY